MLQSVDLEFSETGKMTLPMIGVTIFVGPNNSGKSLVLREIEAALGAYPTPSNLHIIKNYTIEWPSEASVKKNIEKIKSFASQDARSSMIHLGILNPSKWHLASSIDERQLFDVIEKKNQKNWILIQYINMGVLRLDGRSRFNLTNDQVGGDLLAPPQNILAHLFQDDSARSKVRAFVKDAFGLNFVIDPTNLGHLRIRLSSESSLADNQSLNADARAFYAKALHIKDSSDGVQAFTGIVATVCAGEFHTLLVDEPEAFLHPPLARKLGKSLADLAAEHGGSLIASTHSADFLMGCVQASSSVRVVRLEYSGGKSRGRVIDPDMLQSFFKRPLMRSANVISGLFHDGVIICESDNDRAFYGEIYHRLSEGKAGYPSILFINAQNKQTIKDMMGPLRQFGVPAAAIPDIDFVKDGGKTWTEWLKAAQMPDALHAGYGDQRAAIKRALEATEKDMKIDGGIEILDADNKSAAEQLFDNLEKFGIFPVRHGELESWLLHLKVPGKKTDWTVAMLERLGSDSTDPSYVKPGHEDVWQFVEKIVDWIRNPARKGTS